MYEHVYKFIKWIEKWNNNFLLEKKKKKTRILRSHFMLTLLFFRFANCNDPHFAKTSLERCEMSWPLLPQPLVDELQYENFPNCCNVYERRF